MQLKRNTGIKQTKNVCGPFPDSISNLTQPFQPVELSPYSSTLYQKVMRKVVQDSIPQVQFGLLTQD